MNVYVLFINDKCYGVFKYKTDILKTVVEMDGDFKFEIRSFEVQG